MIVISARSVVRFAVGFMLVWAIIFTAVFLVGYTG
jgi:hypothetical protein